MIRFVALPMNHKGVSETIEVMSPVVSYCETNNVYTNFFCFDTIDTKV